ncbi:DUF1330 domain-containing protein [Bosea sp. 685]|uniref:DUF1330 domain-containing protein n=1 Tax=Bosea sp. 685 TaxID=3080057 RepID=UPI0028936C4A|nr:DUF1330 domain-containing protein [Bosea sp. 685]WNJ91203.1 DUF1330 domain-containing protein [Bosea sp. 685]
MTAYAIAHLQDVDLGPEILSYISAIDATLIPFGGRFLVHGATPEVVEGPWPGDLVMIAFPDMEAVRGWYASPAYQEILPLRTRNSTSVTMLVDGVPEGYKATQVLAKLG